MMKKPTVIDLFCGCGGLSYGFILAGFKVLLGVDNDIAALKTFELNHPEAKGISTDISDLTKHDIAKIIGTKSVDVIIGGPPCQGFSLSGPRKFDDPRNKLYLSFIRLVKELKPAVFLIENVPGIAGLYKGRIRDEIIERFRKLGYNVNYWKINAADYGVPQLRNRVFFIGLYRSKESFVLPEPLLNDSNYITAEEAIGDLPALEHGIGQDPVKYPSSSRLTKYQKWCRQTASHLHNHLGTRHDEKTKMIVALVPEGGNYKDLPLKYANTRNFHVAWTRLHSKKPASTVDTGHRHHFHYRYNRVPSVRENARLQSFPDSFIFIGNKSQQYRQVGNAVPPLLAKVLAEKIKMFL